MRDFINFIRYGNAYFSIYLHELHLFNDKPITPVNALQFLYQTLLLLTLQAEHEVGFCCSELRIWDSSLAVTVQLNRIPLGTYEALGVHVYNGIHVSVLAKT